MFDKDHHFLLKKNDRVSVDKVLADDLGWVIPWGRQLEIISVPSHTTMTKACHEKLALSRHDTCRDDAGMMPGWQSKSFQTPICVICRTVNNISQKSYIRVVEDNY